MTRTTTTLPDDDWTELSDEWRASSAIPSLDELRPRVRARSRRMRAILGVEIALTAGALWLIGSAWRVARTWEDWLVVGGLSLFTMVIWVFSLHNRRGTWRAASESLVAYARLEELRKARRRAAARFTWRLCLVALAPLTWLTITRIRTFNGDLLETPVLVCLAATAYLLFSAAAAWRVERGYRR